MFQLFSIGAVCPDVARKFADVRGLGATSMRVRSQRHRARAHGLLSMLPRAARSK